MRHPSSCFIVVLIYICETTTTVIKCDRSTVFHHVLLGLVGTAISHQSRSLQQVVSFCLDIMILSENGVKIALRWIPLTRVRLRSSCVDKLLQERYLEVVLNDDGLFLIVKERCMNVFILCDAYQ